MTGTSEDLIMFIEGLTGYRLTPMQRKLVEIFDRRMRVRWSSVTAQADRPEDEEHVVGYHGADFREGEECD